MTPGKVAAVSKDDDVKDEYDKIGSAIPRTDAVAAIPVYCTPCVLGSGTIRRENRNRITRRC